MPVLVGWIVVLGSIAAYAAVNLMVYSRRRAANLVTAPLVVIVLRIVVLAAVLISPSLGGTGYGQGMDLAHQLVGQVVGVLAVAAWSAIATAIAALMVSMALPMRVTRDDELAGLDMASHGENAIQND